MAQYKQGTVWTGLGLWCLMPCSTIFQNLTISFIGEGNRSIQRKPLTCCKTLSNFITWCCIECTLPWAGFKLTTLVVIGTDCIAVLTMSTGPRPKTSKTLFGPVIFFSFYLELHIKINSRIWFGPGS